MRSFIGFGQQQYIGTPYTRAIKLGGINAVAAQLLFQWISYGASTVRPNINVLVSLDNATCRALDQIRSVYIDNLGSDNPVYIYFPDTGLTLVAKPNSEGWYPAYTNSKVLWVIGEGFLTGSVPQTLILVSNVPMATAVNNEIDNAVALWRASPVIARGTSIYNSSLGIPALGDQFFASSLSNLQGAFTVPLWGSPYPSGFIYITSLTVNALALQAPAVTQGNLVLESTGIAGQLLDIEYIATTNYVNGISVLYSASGLQIKLDATQTWRIRPVVFIPQGFAQVISTFTQQP